MAKQYYTHTWLSDHLIRIDSANESAYLALGADHAALIDTCSGAGNIGDYARSLTSLPLLCILTHGHVDHIGGAMTVSPRYLSARDFDLAKSHGSYELRRDHLLSRPEDGVDPLDILPGQVEGFLPLEDLQRFDLGGLHLMAFPLPGHTLGSMSILLEEDRTLLLGDACNPLTFLFFEGMPSIEEYQETLTAFWDRWNDRFDHLLFSHFEQADKEMILENIRVCQEILQGTADDVPLNLPRFSRNGEEPFIAKRVTGHPRERRRVDGKVGNIVYSRHNIFRKAETV